MSKLSNSKKSCPIINMVKKSNRKAFSKLYRSFKKLGGKYQDFNLKAYNSKGAQKIYQNFIEQNKNKSVTRGQLYKDAKTLGYTGVYNKSTKITLNQFLEASKINSIEDINRLFKAKYVFQVNTLNKFKQLLINKMIEVKLKSGSSKWTKITFDNIDKVIEMIVNYGVLDVVDAQDSDGLQGAEVGQVIEFVLDDLSKRVPKVNKGRKKANAWFPYLNGSDLELSRYQIYTDNNVEEDIACIIFSLQKAGVEEFYLKEICNLMESGIYIPNDKLHLIANTIKRKLIVTTWKDGRTRKSNYGKNYEETIQLGCLLNHYFINEKTKYTKFYVEHREEIDSYNNDEKRFSYTELYRTYKPTHINSFTLVRLLLEKGYFKEYKTAIKPAQLYKVQADITNLDVNQQKFEPVESKLKPKTYFVADIESDVVTNETHKAIAMSFKVLGSSEEPYVFTGPYMFKNFFTKIIELTVKDSKAVIYFHNAKYDTNVFQKLDVVSEVSKGSSFYSKTFNYFGSFIEVRDSLKYFGQGGGLGNLPKMLNLGKQFEKGEAIGYTYHTEENILCNDLIETSEYKRHIKKSEHKIFDEIMDGETRFNPTKYYLNYLKQDVIVLDKALIKFRVLIKEVTGLDALESLTISSIGHKYAVKFGCYEDVYETKGCLREFIQQTIRGGRVFVNPEYKNKIQTGGLQDFDGVSLYPSAMARLCQKHGIAIGQIYKGTCNFEDYKDKSYYIVKIMVNKLNRKCTVPHIGVKNKSGILKYSNNLIGEEIYIDKYALEDLEKYQDAQFQVLEGIYWNNGYNTKIGDLANELHDERCKYKKSNPALGNVLKLLMNSIYGKTIMKKSTEKIVYVTNKQVEEGYLYNNFGIISSYEKITDFRYKVTLKDFDASYSLNHVGASILSTSKVIMNEVFYIMDENKLKMFYTDTDSIHMLDDDVTKLAEGYKAHFNRELIGKNLGQFHSDFDLKGAVGDPTSIWNVSLGPKCYLDVLKGKNDKGADIYSTHIRIKGVTETGIDSKINEYKQTSYIERAKALYTDLSKGKEIEFTLNPTKDRVMMEYVQGGIRTRELGSFKRKLKF